MGTEDKAILLDNILMRAAEQVGDVTGPAMAAYYQRCPEARQSFEKHCAGNLSQLEGSMVENSIFCLMRWIEAPNEIRIMLSESVPHHNDILQVPPEWYVGLLEAVADVIADTIPDDRREEQELWSCTRDQLVDTIEGCRRLIARQGVNVAGVTGYL